MNLPLDSTALSHIEHALDGSYVWSDEADGPTVVGADFTLHQLLQFWSGYSEDQSIPETSERGTPYHEYHGAMVSERDLIRALVTEVRRLRTTHEPE